MKLSVNFSQILIDLLNDNPNLPIDYIKIPLTPFPDCWYQFNEGKQYRKLLPHLNQPGVMELGHPDSMQRFNNNVVQEVFEKANPPYLSTHINAKSEFRQV